MAPSVLDCCDTPPELCKIRAHLPKFAKAVRELDAFNVVAIGSSSTAGEGASPAASYPNRLSEAFASTFSRPRIYVLNLGVGGQEAPDEAARFKKDVIAKNPSLVIWQVGTNAAWKDYILEDVQEAIFRGLKHLEGISTDVILMNLQYAPALLHGREQAKPSTERMLALIADAAAKSGVGLFDRFQIMKFWHQRCGVPFEHMISNSDGNWLHQNDWSYNCIAQALCKGIVGAVTPPPAA
jgi:hypothetical protein